MPIIRSGEMGTSRPALGVSNTPSAATQSPGSASSANRGGSAPRPSVPFIRASAEHVEAPFFDQTYTQNANLQDFGVVEVPAYGYVRNIVIMVTAVTSANA